MRSRLERNPNVARVLPSDANFLLVECRDASKFYAAAQVRWLDRARLLQSAPGLSNCLRISIGTPDQNQRLLAAVEHA